MSGMARVYDGAVMALTRARTRVDYCDGARVVFTIFVDDEDAGTLTMTPGDYALVCAALKMGAERTMGHLSVEHDDRVFIEWRLGTTN